MSESKTSGGQPNRRKRLSLYGMTPEVALRRALTTPPPKTPEKPPARVKAKDKRKRKTG